MLLLILIIIFFLAGYFIFLLLKPTHGKTLTIASLFGMAIWAFFYTAFIIKESITTSHVLAVFFFELYVVVIYSVGGGMGVIVRWLSKKFGNICGALITLAMLTGMFSYSPLPSDEKMIAHFQAHKEEFDTLAQDFRAYIPQNHPQQPFDTVPEHKMLMNKAAIRRVFGYGVDWFPDPYSAVAAKRFEVLKKLARSNRVDLTHPFRSIRFTLQNQALGHPSIGLWDWLTKDYVYFPEIPKIEDGRLWYPVNAIGHMKSSERAASSLNYVPLGWIPACVYRQIEPHWFLVMCYQ